MGLMSYEVYNNYLTLVTDGEQTNIIEEYEKQISELENQILIQKQILEELIQNHQSENFEKQIIQLTEKIIELRDELIDARKNLVSISDLIVD